MNDINDKILSILASMTVENENLVIAKREIIEMVDDAIGVDELDKRIEALEVNDLVVVRYSDGESYCLALRPKGRINAEKIKKAEMAAAIAAAEAEKEEVVDPRQPVLSTEEEEKPQNTVPAGFSFKKLALICAGSSFVGGLLAAIVAFLLAKLG